MSEYQYYEFQAIDKSLDDRQMGELRDVSSRAVITPNSFVNEYNWGDFKGDPDEWMEKYFDAFLYLANWGTHRFMLRFPKRLVNPGIADLYFTGESIYARIRGDYVIFSFESESENEDWMEPEGLLSSLIPLRSEIMHGDMRCLYLAWLVCVQNGEVEDDEIEPDVPPDLDGLTVSERSFVEFLGIDDDLIEVAACGRFRPSAEGDRSQKIESWIRSLPELEKDTLLLRVLNDEVHLGTELRIRFSRLTDGEHKPESRVTRRTAGELLATAEKLAAEKKRQEAIRAAAEKSRREKKAAIDRKKYLRGIAGKVNQVWLKIEKLISTKQPVRYDEAVKLLVDLRDLAELKGKTDAFASRCQELCRKHQKKPSLLRRIKKEF